MKHRPFSGIFLKLFIGLLSVFLVLGLCVWIISASYQKYAASAFETVDFEFPGQRAVNTALGIAQWGGKDVLIKWLLDEKRNVRPAIFVLTATGEEISGRTLPNKAQAQLTDPVVSSRIVTKTIAGEPLRFIAVRTDKPKHFWGMAFWRTPWWVHVLLALFSTALVAGLLAWNLTKPIRKLDWAMRRAAEGNFGDRIAPLVGHNYDEIGDLAKRYDAMAKKINGLLKRQKTLFHDVSHELRSPLARIDVALALLEKDPTKSRQAVERIEEEVANLDTLVEALLTYARLDENAPMHFETTDLVPILETIVEDADFEGSAKNVRVTLTSDAALPVLAHIDSIASALENLIRNALRFSPAGTTVSVLARKTDRMVTVEICDSGPGIAESDIARLFDPFVRGSNQATGSGFGLGLAIAKRAAIRHSGTLNAENITPHGLKMRLTLPLLSVKDRMTSENPN